MSTTCLSCGKKIGLLSNVISTKHHDGTLCYDCTDYLTKVTSLYYKTPDCYSGQQLKTCMAHKSEMVKFINEVDEITRRYQSIIKRFQNDQAEHEQRIAKLKKDDEEERAEFKKDLTNVELYYNEIPDLNEMKARCERQKRLGYLLEASQLAELITEFEQHKQHYEKSKQSIIETRDYYSEGTNLLISVAEAYMEGCKENINLFNRVLQAEKYIYSKTRLPKENHIFGGIGSNCESGNEKIESCIDEIVITYCDVINVYFNELSETDNKLFRQMEKTYQLIISEYDDINKSEGMYDNINKYDEFGREYNNTFVYRLNKSEKNMLRHKSELLYPLYLQYISFALLKISHNITLYFKTQEVERCFEYDEWIMSPPNNISKTKVLQAAFGYKIEDWIDLDEEYVEAYNVINDIYSKLKNISPKLEFMLSDNYIENEQNGNDIYCESDNELYEFICPKCGFNVAFEFNVIAAGSTICPNCGEKLEFDFSEEDETENEEKLSDLPDADLIEPNENTNNELIQQGIYSQTNIILSLITVLQNIANTKKSTEDVEEFVKVTDKITEATNEKTNNDTDNIKNDFIKTPSEVISENNQIKLCPACQKENKPTAKFCKYCGEGLEPLQFCEDCGAKLKPGKKFCSKCGAKIE